MAIQITDRPTAVRGRWVYDFAEGSRDMRDLLGGKGANVAEMTRVLGPERVPAGFTITTEACVGYMHGGEPEGWLSRPRPPWNASRRVPGRRFEGEIARVKRERGVTEDVELDVDALRGLALAFKRFYPFPDDPRDQLRGAIRAVFESWTGARGDVSAHPPHP